MAINLLRHQPTPEGRLHDVLLDIRDHLRLSNALALMAMRETMQPGSIDDPDAALPDFVEYADAIVGKLQGEE